MPVTCDFNSNATRKHRDFSPAFSSSFAFRAKVKQWLGKFAYSCIRNVATVYRWKAAEERQRERERAAEWVYRHQTGSHFDDAAVMTHKTIHKAQAKCLCVHVCVHYTSQGLSETKSMKRSHESLRAWQQQSLEFVQRRNGFPTHDFLMLIKT